MQLLINNCELATHFHVTDPQPEAWMRHQYQKIVYDCFKTIILLSYVQEPAFFNEISYVCMFHVSDTPSLHINISRSLYKSCLSTPIVVCPENQWITGMSATDGYDSTV